eukprot:2779683-Rhodomonas_salina.4
MHMCCGDTRVLRGGARGGAPGPHPSQVPLRLPFRAAPVQSVPVKRLFGLDFAKTRAQIQE